MEKDKQESEENSPESLTSKERLRGSPDSPQEANGSSSGKEDFISDPSIEDPSDNKQKMKVKKRKQQLKTKERKGEATRLVYPTCCLDFRCYILTHFLGR